jgi:hypothetical protein
VTRFSYIDNQGREQYLEAPGLVQAAAKAWQDEYLATGVLALADRASGTVEPAANIIEGSAAA